MSCGHPLPVVDFHWWNLFPMRGDVEILAKESTLSQQSKQNGHEQKHLSKRL
jgi:hypothetical protein